MSDPILLLSHGALSKKIVGAHRGEMANATKLHTLLEKANYPVTLTDLYEFFDGDIKELYHPLGLLNIELAESGYPILDETSIIEGQKVIERILAHKPSFLFLLSWEWSAAALFGLGLHKKCPTATKLYVHHKDTPIMSSLFEPSDVLLTESLLASTCAIKAGISPWKLIFLPHHYTADTTPPSRAYVERLIAKSGKNIKLTNNTVIIGSISRLFFGKNCEFMLEVAKKLADEGKDILYVFKGDLEAFPLYPTYNEKLKNLFESLSNEKWFLWDRTISPYSEMSDIFASFDIFLHLSSADAGSNVIVEALSMGKPTVTLDASTNPSLFSNAALFVNRKEKTPEENNIPFQLPCREDAYRKVHDLVNDRRLREEVGRKGGDIAQKRFHPDRTLERMPLILQACKAYHYQTKDMKTIQSQVEKLFEEDQKLYKTSA